MGPKEMYNPNCDRLATIETFDDDMRYWGIMPKYLHCDYKYASGQIKVIYVSTAPSAINT